MKGSLAKLGARVVLAISAVPAVAAAQQLGGAEPVDVPVGRMIAGLLLCVVVAFGLAMMIRARGRLPQLPSFTLGERLPARLRVLEARRISQQAEGCLLACDAQEYLVLIGAGQPILLRSTPEGE